MPVPKTAAIFPGSTTATRLNYCTRRKQSDPATHCSHRNVQTTSPPYRSHKPQHQRNQDPSLPVPRRRTHRPSTGQCRLLRRERGTQCPHPSANDEPPRVPIERISANLDMDRHRVFRPHAARMVEARGVEFTGAV